MSNYHLFQAETESHSPEDLYIVEKVIVDVKPDDIPDFSACASNYSPTAQDPLAAAQDPLPAAQDPLAVCVL